MNSIGSAQGPLSVLSKSLRVSTRNRILFISLAVAIQPASSKPIVGWLATSVRDAGRARESGLRNDTVPMA